MATVAPDPHTQLDEASPPRGGRTLPGHRTLLAAALLGLGCVGCVGCVVAGQVTGRNNTLFPVAGVLGLAAYALFARWVARHENKSGFVRHAERIRRMIAYEGDPGPVAK